MDVSTHAGLRDRALIGLMVYSFARIGAALGLTVEDVFTQNRRLRVRLRENGGKRRSDGEPRLHPDNPALHSRREELTPSNPGSGVHLQPRGGEVPARRPALQLSPGQRERGSGHDNAPHPEPSQSIF
jgi:integrase